MSSVFARPAFLVGLVHIIHYYQIKTLSICLDSGHVWHFCTFSYSQDPQILFFRKLTLKLGLTLLFIYLKIILLQYF